MHLAVDPLLQATNTLQSKICAFEGTPVNADVVNQVEVVNVAV